MMEFGRGTHYVAKNYGDIFIHEGINVAAFLFSGLVVYLP